MDTVAVHDETAWRGCEGEPVTAQLEYPGVQDDDALLSIQGLWKVFGPKAQRVPHRPELAALDRTALYTRTGCTAAVRDLSFDVAPGDTATTGANAAVVRVTFHTR